MLLLNKDIRNSYIIADFTGSTDWINSPINKQAIADLLEKKPYLLFCDIDIEVSNVQFAYICNSFDSIEIFSSRFIHEEMESGEFEAIVITTNTDRIKSWTELNFSTIYIETEGDNNLLQHEHMPDEIWGIEDFIDFVYKDFNGSSYFMERIGLPNAQSLPYTYYTFEDNNRITNTQYEVVFAGRSFKVADNRQYIHLLSRSLKEFKFEVNGEVRGARKAIFVLFNKLLLEVLSNIEDITLITAIPPRPNQQHRFFGFEDFYTGDIPLDFNILETIDDYETPKQYRTYEEKYNCVKGAFDCTAEVEGHIILLDDIYTTGVTTSECVRKLLEAGATKVTVVPIAHTQACPAEQYLLKGFISENGDEYVPRFNNASGINFWIKKITGGRSRNYKEIFNEYIEQNNYWNHTDSYGYFSQDFSRAKAVIFDLDNTLIQTDSLETIRFKSFFTSSDERFIIGNSRELISSEILAKLKNNGIKIGIVTRAKKAYAEKILSLYNYDYDVLITRYSCFRTKPFPDPFISCAYKLGVDPTDVLTIGNEQVDLDASHAAKMAAYIIKNNNLDEIIDTLEGLITSS
ncbi:HAD hydrolase-like protein [Bacillus ndiopicus]|uniref:HAD hydrolase-like protein n=1 Tax=Bacillus ndiopicus TaxID=1347368 RepID=UPI0006932CAA|nr:HAD hydrolase-like protein [Bacillus ndiopicus]